MDGNDLEKHKFVLDSWKVKLKTSAQIAWVDDIWNRDINDMEKNKFDTNWYIRIITAI